MSARRAHEAFFAAFAIVLSLTAALSAAFDNFHASPRALAMGGAWVAVADDSLSASANPAGMVQLSRAEAAASYADLYGADGLAANRVSAVFPSGASAAGADWERLGLPGVYYEDKITAAFARQMSDVLSAGFGLKILRSEVVGFDAPFYPGSRNAAAFGAGILWQLSDSIIAGFAADNINEPRISDDERLSSAARFGIRYHPFDGGLIAAELESAEKKLRAGFETVVGGALAVRLGLDRGRPTFGFGFITPFLKVDFAVLTDSNLGLLTCAGLRMQI